MSVHQLPAPRITGLLGDARGCVASAAGTPVDRLDGSEIAEAISELSRLESQAASLRMTLSVEADDRELAEREAATGTDSWLAALTGDTREVARGGLLIARLLEERYGATREAFAGGELRIPQVRVIVHAAEKIPDWATAEQVRAAEEWLVGKATGVGNRSGRPMNARSLRQVARRMCLVVDAELARAHETALLNKETRRAEEETWFTLQDNGDGTYRGRFVISELHGSLLMTCLQTLTSPRRLTRDRTGAPMEDDTLPGAGPGLNWSESLGAAFCELIEHLPTDGWKGRSAITLLVRTGLEELRTGLGGASLDGGVRISASEARRLACNAGIIPAVMGGTSVPLDVGREERLHTRYQRLALAAAHDTCAAAGCDRPFAWCEIHHPHASADGGATSVDNGLPLCGFHHRRAHDDRFDLRRTTAGDWRFHRRR